MLDLVYVKFCQIGQVWLTFLKAKHERDLPVESIALNQVGVIALTVNQLQYEHLNKNKGSVDRGKDSLDRVLPAISIFVFVVWVRPHRFENDSIGT